MNLKNSIEGHVYSFVPITTTFSYTNGNHNYNSELNCTNNKFNRCTMMETTKEQVYRTYFTFSIPRFELTLESSQPLCNDTLHLAQPGFVSSHPGQH